MERPKRRSRWGRLKDKCRPLKDAGLTVADTTQTLVAPLQELSDAFPPLNGVAGSVMALWNIAQRAKRSKSDAEALAQHANDVLRRVSSALNMENPDDLPGDLQGEIQQFEQLVQEISHALKPLTSNNPLLRFAQLNRNEDRLVFYKRRLDEVCQGFLMGSVSRQEAKLAELKREVTGIRLDLQHGYRVTTVQYHDEIQALRMLREQSLMFGVLFS